ncbi:flagellar export protein FliJ [Paucisalibacillus sp. EB02]|uniref:flagellar export protein FliJ n=1 Tax=Paucisalibacillus sp. EB02 TaxID=1347087 RepID=UPI0004AD9D1C|nr:flagellar export protein FliJ [Paucisalibacillus sp. EB02]
MAGTAVLTKILDIREREKQDAQIAYRKSVDTFEEVATELFELLRKKEAAEASYEKGLTSSMHLNLIQDQLAYMETLEKKIAELQRRVSIARSNMEYKQQTLSDAHVETKKYEKIIEFRRSEARDKVKKVEDSFMNEISIQQYLSHK